MEPSITLVLSALAACFTFTIAADTSANDSPVGTLYAYGTNISGLPLFYGDGKCPQILEAVADSDDQPGAAYLGYGQPKDVSTAVNVTFHIGDSMSTLVSSPNDTTLASNWSTPLLYIDTSTGSFAQAGFVSLSNTTYTTSGFKFWGRQLLWMGESGNDSVGRSFWAAPQGESGLWKLLWNSDNAASESAVPVVLKRLPPPSRDDD